VASASSSAPAIKHGVAPLRAGQGSSFVLRRLHSLSGIVPIGLFLLEHFISNAEAFKGVDAYGKQVAFLNSLPFVLGLEVFGIWMYTAQRWTGIIAFAYMIQHTYYLRFSGVRLPEHPMQSFAKVQHEFQNPWMVAVYAIAIVAASWHFSYGLWLFAAKWGITTGDRARRWFGYACILLAVGLIGIGAASMYGFLSTAPQTLNPTGP
jgi:succinate dehydrogenase / fumarate reductase cytochrome b subunit